MSHTAIGIASIAGGVQAGLTAIRFNGLYRRSQTIDPATIEGLQMSRQNRRLLQRFASNPAEGKKAVAMATGTSTVCLAAGLALMIF